MIQEELTVNIVQLVPEAIIPSYAHEGDAGVDLFATDKELDANGNMVYKTGLAMQIPKGHVGLLFPRSSISKTNLSLANCVGVIDSSYRGEVVLKFKPTLKWYNDHYVLDPLEEYGVTYEKGERVGQLIIIPYPKINFNKVPVLASSDRGTGGFGSTGK